MAYKPIYLNDQGTVREIEQFHINDNGTVREISDVYLNDQGTVRHIFSRHPYPPGTEIFTYRWDDWYSQGSPVSGHTMQAAGSPSGSNYTIANFINDYPTLYPLVFDGTPYFTGGSGGSNSTIRFKLNPGFTVSYYRQSQLGTDSDGDGTNTGGSYNLWRGNTVSGLGSIDYGLSLSGSGNNWSEFKVSYIG